MHHVKQGLLLMQLNILPNGLKQPLVSIIVITYNSSKYVLETLQSAKEQIYQNIELIISDDCSTDNTIELCAQWIEDNKHRFIAATLVFSHENTGIAANCNRGLKIAKGVWIKFIAGDDILRDNCISDCIKYINNSSEEVRLLCGRVKEFTNDIECKDIENEFIDQPDLFFKKTAREQHLLLLKANRILAPAVFIKRSLLSSMNGFDERHPMLEDYPFWLKVTENGVKIHDLSKIITFYRVHNESVYNSAFLRPYIINPFYEHLERFEKNYVYERLNYAQKLERRYRYTRYRLIIYLGNNRNNYFVRYLNAVLKLLNRRSPCEIR